MLPDHSATSNKPSLPESPPSAISEAAKGEKIGKLYQAFRNMAAKSTAY